MRITPNQPRLRVVALACWATGAWCALYGARLGTTGRYSVALTMLAELLALMLLAVGVAFWLLSGDRRAGIVFDAKGLLLNLGHSSAFVAWENIERVGVVSYRASLFDIGSRHQIGIALYDVGAYVQSYEQRLPSGRGPLARALELLARLLRPFDQSSDQPLLARLSLVRARTGYDVLIPEALLGGKAESFAGLVEFYRLQPVDRYNLDGMAWAV
jgi:hypothetical protein